MNKIAISGKIASGKTTVSDYISNNYGHIQIRSAEYLKKLCMDIAIGNKKSQILTGKLKTIYSEAYETVQFIAINEEESRLIWNRLKPLMKEFNDVLDTSKKTDRVRSMLQIVANDLIDNVRQTIWIDSLIKGVGDKLETSPLFVHDDLRYPFEALALRNAGFTLIRLDISKEEQLKRVGELYPDLNLKRLNHKGETALDKHGFDYVISSNQPLEDMLTEINTIIRK